MEALRKNHKRIISLKQAKKLLFVLIFILLFDFLLFPFPALATESAIAVADTGQEIVLASQDQLTEATTEPEIINRLPENNNWTVKSSSYHMLTAYNSEVGQTDDSPCITANGFNLCSHGIEDTIAANFLYFGTKVRIPELFGDKVFVVRDRMNARYSDRVDVWMINKQDAKQFGAKVAKIEIVE